MSYKEKMEISLFQAGREVIFALPPGSSTLKPNSEELQVAATILGLSVAATRKALDFYNYSENFPHSMKKEKICIIKQQ